MATLTPTDAASLPGGAGLDAFRLPLDEEGSAPLARGELPSLLDRLPPTLGDLYYAPGGAGHIALAYDGTLLQRGPLPDAGRAVPELQPSQTRPAPAPVQIATEAPQGPQLPRFVRWTPVGVFLTTLLTPSATGGGRQVVSGEALGDDVRLSKWADEAIWNVEQRRDGEWVSVGSAREAGDTIQLDDPARISAEVGRELPAVLQVGASPGSGVETRTQEERDLVSSMAAQGRSSTEIQNAVEALRAGVSTPGAARDRPGVASVSGDLPTIEGTWLRGTEDNYGVIPAQVASQLEGRRFESFGEFRGAFWRAVAATPELAAQFDGANLGRMQRGFAPVASENQAVGRNASYVLHHRTPIAQGGAVYDLSNLAVVTPRFHQDILARGYHYGGGR